MTTTATYRKTRQGEWVVMAPEAMVGRTEVTVTTKAGAIKTELVSGWGKIFETRDGRMAYGYLDRRDGDIWGGAPRTWIGWV